MPRDGDRLRGMTGGAVAGAGVAPSRVPRGDIVEECRVAGVPIADGKGLRVVDLRWHPSPWRSWHAGLDTYSAADLGRPCRETMSCRSRGAVGSRSGAGSGCRAVRIADRMKGSPWWGLGLTRLSTTRPRHSNDRAGRTYDHDVTLLDNVGGAITDGLNLINPKRVVICGDCTTKRPERGRACSGTSGRRGWRLPGLH
jgi:hypothetical protein